MIRVAIVSPAFTLRAGLRVVFTSAPADAEGPLRDVNIRVVGEAARFAELEKGAAQVDVLVATVDGFSNSDFELPGWLQDGSCALLLLADNLKAAQSLTRLPLRAWGILPLEASAEELIAAVYALSEGLVVIAPSLARVWLTRPENLAEFDSEPRLESLTERENQVLQLLARGLANKQIASLLAISEHTVKFHVSSIYAKLGVTNRTEAVRRGVQQGLVAL